LLGALAGGGEKGFRCRRVRIFFQEMMFHYPGVIIAEPVGSLELGQRVLVEPELVALFPWAWQLQLVKDTEFHVASPNTACCFGSVYSPSAASPASTTKQQFRDAEAALHGTRGW